MPNIAKLNYELSDFNEANEAISKYEKSSPPNVAPYPYFEIDYIDINQYDELTIWLKLKKE